MICKEDWTQTEESSFVVGYVLVVSTGKLGGKLNVFTPSD